MTMSRVGVPGTSISCTGPEVDSDTVMHIEDLYVRFQRSGRTVHAVNGVSLRIAAGKSIGIVGESGSGKSVLARSMIGLLPQAGLSTSGSIRLRGRELAQLSDRQWRPVRGAGVSMVFQDPLSTLNPVIRIGKQIQEAVRAHTDASKVEARARAADLLASVQVPEPLKRLDQYPGELSGGMRQRVAIAIALAANPDVLVADEPTTALDVTIQAEILDLLQQIQAERSMSIVLISHDLGVVAGRTDEVAVMYGGRIVERGPTAAVFEQPEMPYTRALLEAIPRLDAPKNTRLAVVGGQPPDPTWMSAGCRFAPRCPKSEPHCDSNLPSLRPASTPGHAFACWIPEHASTMTPAETVRT